MLSEVVYNPSPMFWFETLPEALVTERSALNVNEVGERTDAIAHSPFRTLVVTLDNVPPLMVSPFPFRAKLKVKLSVTLATRYVPSVLDSSLPTTFT